MSIIYIIFGAIFVGYLLFDLLVLNRRAHTPTLREVVGQTIFAIALAGAFAITLWLTGNPQQASEFTAVYITEKMLSLDNLFVILVIFQFFAIDKQYQHKTLFYGILGAVAFRLLFISLGSVLVQELAWVLYLFAIALIWTGYKVSFGASDSHNQHEKIAHHPINRLLHKYIPYTAAEHHGKFFVRHNGRRLATMMLFALIMIEVSDIVFALDSIPAAFAITNNAPIIFTANLAAILGLRSLFFVVEILLEKLRYLQYGLGAVLVFIGLKFLLAKFIHLEPTTSLVIIMGILGIATAVSLYPTRTK